MSELSLRKRMAIRRATAVRLGLPDADRIGRVLSVDRGRRWARRHREQYGPMDAEELGWFRRTLGGVGLPGDSEKTVPSPARVSDSDTDTRPELGKRDPRILRPDSDGK